MAGVEKLPRSLEGATVDSGTGGMSLRAQVEALVFASKEPISSSDIALILGESTYLKEVQQVLGELVEEYNHKKERGETGFFLRELAGSYQFQTVPESEEMMRKLFHLKPRPLSRAAQETLAIIAYREPVTRADIEYIRGLNAGSILRNLLEKGLIQAVGRKEDSGRPLLFATTAKFLSMFGLSSLSDLPPLESFQPAREDVNLGEKYLEEQDEVQKNSPEEDFMLSSSSEVSSVDEKSSLQES